MNYFTQPLAPNTQLLPQQPKSSTPKASKPLKPKPAKSPKKKPSKNERQSLA